ncbi:MAG: carbon monoxide dehydrogenase accessory protein CooC [Actinobacteria bacterium]|nr:carbon monoxide dehydrogenase accessory protein CooC [Actinomycetota bacterium]MCL6088383.1 carbon monoxide dehydrogenase accessory protein CooC [Actinomycetota bacterium]
MKIAVSGKGGVGKTTVAACLAKYYANKGYRVIAVDADPDANLAWALGLDYREASKIVPLTEMKDLIEERTGAKPGQYGSYFKLNPKVDDIPQKYGIDVNGVRLLSAGTIKAGGSGCYCPENILLKRLFKHLVVDRDEVIILDMEAGIEHLGRGTCENMDILIVVTEPGLRSIQTAQSIKKLSKDLGVKSVYAVINKIRSKDELEFLKNELKDFKVIGELPYSEKVRESDLKNISPCSSDDKFTSAVAKTADKINAFINK